MKYFVWSISSFHCFKKDCCQLQVKSRCTEYWLTTKSRLAQKKSVVRSSDGLDMTIAVDWHV